MTDITAPYGPLAFFLDLHPDLGDFEADVIKGLSLPQKSLSPKYFYDAYGSKLFNHITELEEYYPTRTEKEIFRKNAKAITASVGPGAAIFEYGSGSSEKIEWLINGLVDPTAYVALDISKTHLIESASSLTRTHKLPIAAICADFHTPIILPSGLLPQEKRWLGFFPGSTLGNMTPDGAVALLENASKTLGAGAKFLLGVDLEKDPAILRAAYDDKKGVTAAFNLNLLRRMQRELDAELCLDDFVHHALFNDDLCRIEMHLRAIKPTSIMVKGRKFTFAEGETLHTENSHKYSVTRLKKLIEQTPWRLEEVWTDPKDWYAACLLSNR